ncbi:endonuclease V [Lysobacter sp. Hz 25]|uniref:endonuclease V n=1 Tax=Lysobacter sp. Hz 25 TaxID=3383698 RepID=UPI0038D3BFD2
MSASRALDGPVLAVDVHYLEAGARVAGVLFDDWADPQATAAHTLNLDQVEDYAPGEFYRRELPCLLALLGRIEPAPACIVVDGYVWLGADRRPGLGAHLWQALDRRCPVVGVAKTRFADTPAEAEVCRGNSRRPLYVTSAGLDPEAARAAVRAMYGAHRLPELLKRADRLARIGDAA